MALLLASAVVLGGCGDEADTRAETAGLPTVEDEVAAREWLLDAGASTPGIGAGQPVTLTLRAGRAAGTGPCNAFGGGFDLDGDRLSFDRLATTRRACEPAVMAAEDAFLDALGAVAAVEVDEDDRLVLTGEGDVRLVFRGYDADERLPGRWEVRDVGAGDVLERVRPGATLVLDVDADGTLVVTGGCNTIAADWRLLGDELTVDLPRATLMACPEPELEEQDDAVRSALERAARVQVTPRTLVLLDDRDAITLYAVRPEGGS